MKIAFSSNAFGRFSLLEAIRILARTGYQGIEIMADTPHAYPPDLTQGDIRRVRTELDRCGLQVSNVNAFMMHAEGDTYHPSWIEPEPELRRRRIDHTLRCIDLAAALGASTLSTEPGGPLDGMAPEKGLQLFREGLEAVQERARRRGVKILIEPEPDLLIETSFQFAAFMQDLDPEVFGLNFDIGHFYCVGEDPALLVSTLKDATGHYHLEDIAASRVHRHLMPGEGALPLPEVIRAIEETGYEGFVTVELYPYEDRAVEAAVRSLAYLREHCPELRREAAVGRVA